MYRGGKAVQPKVDCLVSFFFARLAAAATYEMASSKSSLWHSASSVTGEAESSPWLVGALVLWNFLAAQPASSELTDFPLRTCSTPGLWKSSGAPGGSPKPAGEWTGSPSCYTRPMVCRAELECRLGPLPTKCLGS